MSDTSREAIRIMHKRIGSTPFPDDLQGIVDDADIMIRALCAEGDRLRKALEWYADDPSSQGDEARAALGEDTK